MGYLRGRMITYVIIWFVAINLDFLIPRIAPGNAAEILANGGRLPLVQVHDLQVRFGLLQPVYVQYFLFLKSIFLSFPPDFGFSYQYFPASVSNLFFERLPATALLIGSGLALGIIIQLFCRICFFDEARRQVRNGIALRFNCFARYSSVLGSNGSALGICS